MTAPGKLTEPSPKIAELNLRQLTELLIREHGLHEGSFELSVQFDLAVGVFGLGPAGPLPGVMAMLRSIALSRAGTASPLAVDAAVANPATKPIKKRTGRAR